MLGRIGGDAGGALGRIEVDAGNIKGGMLCGVPLFYAPKTVSHQEKLLFCRA